MIEFDKQLFEDLIADKTETTVRFDETWLIFFDDVSCKRCPQIMDTFEDLANIYELHKSFKIGHILCPRYAGICNRLGIRGLPTISVLHGSQIYDYQGVLSVRALSSFVNDQ